MAPREKPFLNNPIELHTNKAMRVLGRLIETWCTDPSSHPDTARLEADGRLVVFSVDDFKTLLANLPEPDRLTDEDLSIREGIRDIELILRRSDRVPFLLPEPEAMAFQRDACESGTWPGVRLPSIYWNVDTSKGKPTQALMGGYVSMEPQFEDGDKATYFVFAQGDGTHPLDAFIHPYMAAYCCSQCS